MGLKFSETHEIKFYECDVTGKLSLPMLLNIVIKTSESQGEELGRNAEYIHQLGYGWVITQHELWINRLPSSEEVVTVTTESTSYNKYFCYRSFWVHDADGQELVSIESTFVLMDLSTRKMTSVSEEVIAPYQSEKTKKIQRGTKIPDFSGLEERNYRVRFTDIDANKHVNNSRYLDWIIDSLDFDFLMSHQARFVNIRFDKELAYGNMIQSKWQAAKEADGVLVSQHQIKLGETLCAEAAITWQEN